jgi:hypothetical protein
VREHRIQPAVGSGQCHGQDAALAGTNHGQRPPRESLADPGDRVAGVGDQGSEGERPMRPGALAVTLAVQPDHGQPGTVEGVEEFLVKQRVRHGPGQEQHHRHAGGCVPDRQDNPCPRRTQDNFAVGLRALHRVQQLLLCTAH